MGNPSKDEYGDILVDDGGYSIPPVDGPGP